MIVHARLLSVYHRNKNLLFTLYTFASGNFDLRVFGVLFVHGLVLWLDNSSFSIVVLQQHSISAALFWQPNMYIIMSCHVVTSYRDAISFCTQTLGTRH